jgi:hypothetical protein
MLFLEGLLRFKRGELIHAGLDPEKTTRDPGLGGRFPISGIVKSIFRPIR